MEKIFVPVFLVFIVILTVSIQPDAGATANDLDMSNINNTQDKKKRFFDFMRPIIIDENSKILALREKLLNAKKIDLDHSLAAIIAKQYRVDWNGDEKSWQKLLARVDTVALELALAQSANETAWGQSRFAREENNFFGQWCITKGCGVIPNERRRGSTHEVASYDSVNESVRSYIKNLNTGRAYASLRNTRLKNRTAGQDPDAIAQAGGLTKYSARGNNYVKEIRSIIQANSELMQGN